MSTPNPVRNIMEVCEKYT
jgi:hypothetical protein